MDGRVIVVYWNYKVNLLTSDGKVQKQLPISCGVSRVTQINQNTLAISYTYKKAIKIFNIEKETITKVITLDKECRGLAFSNNSLAVCLSCDEICIIDLEGNTLKKIKVSSKSYLENLVYFNDRLIYSDFHGEAVYCIGVSGTPIWEYKHLSIYRPFGLCTDIYGNVFVKDCYSHRTIVISKDGRDSKILLGEEDGLYHPKCICLKDNESYGFICNDIGRHFTKFNIAYE
ncbi:unnamed protein product [Mytilus coruscus]|uniref:TRIM2_3 n=1 Tax=Mytilus coruscus TaxID=42192 RepID=A0A6J8D4D0_MYTCO|nr:unnamed protein product [Mytilus coruscus]